MGAGRIDEYRSAGINNIGVMDFKEGKYKEAASMFQMAVNIDASDPGIYFNCGVAKAHAGKDITVALSYLNYAIKNGYAFADAYHSRGMCHQQLGNLKNAENDFKQAIKLNSANNLSKVLLKITQDIINNSGDKDTALKKVSYQDIDSTHHLYSPLLKSYYGDYEK